MSFLTKQLKFSNCPSEIDYCICVVRINVVFDNDGNFIAEYQSVTNHISDEQIQIQILFAKVIFYKYKYE